MKADSLVSVVIPCFNAERFIEQTLGSVVEQTYENWELVIVDDGSTDNTSRIIEKWKKTLGSRVKVHTGPNRGPSFARNIGTGLASGEFLQYLDSDDLLRPDTLARRLEAFDETSEVAYTDWQKLVEQADGSYIPVEVISRSIEDIHARSEIALFTSFWAPPAAFLYRRSIVDAIGGWNETLPIIQDARFALDAALHGAKFIRVAGVGAYYRISLSPTLSRRHPLAFAEDCYRNARQVEEIWIKRGGLDTDQSKALIDCYSYTARMFFGEDPLLFNENLKKIYRLQPGFKPTYPKLAGFLGVLFGKSHALKVMNFMSLLRKWFP